MRGYYFALIFCRRAGLRIGAINRVHFSTNGPPHADHSGDHRTRPLVAAKVISTLKAATVVSAAAILSPGQKRPEANAAAAPGHFEDVPHGNSHMFRKSRP